MFQQLVDVVLKRTGASRTITKKSYELNKKAYILKGNAVQETQVKKSESVAAVAEPVKLPEETQVIQPEQKKRGRKPKTQVV
jgi:hypothetical protein